MGTSPTRLPRSCRQRGDIAVRRASSLLAGVKGRVSETMTTSDARDLLEEVRRRLEEQAAAGAQRVAENLRRFGEQGVALANGRPQDAPDIGDYVRQTADKLLQAAELADALADEVGSRRIGDLLEDIGGVARRRPGLFVLATAAALAAAVPVARTARLRAAGAPEQENAPAGDQLEPAALDALLRALWPGDVDEGSPAARQRRSVGSDHKRKGQPAEAASSVTGELGQPAQQRAQLVKKRITRAAGAAVDDKPRARGHAAQGQAREPTAEGKDQRARVSASRQTKAPRKPSSAVGENARGAKGTIRSESARTTRAAAPVAESGSAPSSGAARRPSRQGLASPVAPERGRVRNP